MCGAGPFIIEIAEKAASKKQIDESHATALL